MLHDVSEQAGVHLGVCQFPRQRAAVADQLMPAGRLIAVQRQQRHAQERTGSLWFSAGFVLRWICRWITSGRCSIPSKVSSVTTGLPLVPSHHPDLLFSRTSCHQHLVLRAGVTNQTAAPATFGPLTMVNLSLWQTMHRSCLVSGTQSLRFGGCSGGWNFAEDRCFLPAELRSFSLSLLLEESVVRTATSAQSTFRFIRSCSSISSGSDSSGKHLPLEVQSEEVGQEVTCRQTGAEVQSSLTHIQTQRRALRHAKVASNGERDFRKDRADGVRRKELEVEEEEEEEEEEGGEVERTGDIPGAGDPHRKSLTASLHDHLLDAQTQTLLLQQGQNSAGDKGGDILKLLLSLRSAVSSSCRDVFHSWQWQQARSKAAMAGGLSSSRREWRRMEESEEEEEEKLSQYPSSREGMGVDLPLLPSRILPPADPRPSEEEEDEDMERLSIFCSTRPSSTSTSL
ncbi:hypothetical protein F7725_008478 [Dissostichus mawsoni]|uniref:Uncharacterized protein n=1 Tax=Dissostichus mawsoni TaxID=36200 RepID=A0A7J5Y7B7_DISMA|nr:hypothetical protein F7725_008478 [Dissostichus mawsoni]